MTNQINIDGAKNLFLVAHTTYGHLLLWRRYIIQQNLIFVFIGKNELSHLFPTMVKVLTTQRQLRAFLHAPHIPRVAMNRMTPPAATMTMARPSARSAALKLPTDSVFIRGTTFWFTQVTSASITAPGTINMMAKSWKINDIVLHWLAY